MQRIPAVWLVLGGIVSVQFGAAIAKDLFDVVAADGHGLAAAGHLGAGPAGARPAPRSAAAAARTGWSSLGFGVA